MLVGEFVRQISHDALETAPALAFSPTLARRRSRDFVEMITPGYKPQRLFRQTFLFESLSPFGIRRWVLAMAEPVHGEGGLDVECWTFSEY